MDLKQYPTNPVLLVDDVKVILSTYESILRKNGINNLLLCNDSRKVLSLLAEQFFELCILDLKMPFISGEELLRKIKATYPDIPVIVATGTDDVQTAVRCMQAGALDYIVKPVERNRFVSTIRRSIEIRELQSQYRLLKESMLADNLAHPAAFSDIITKNRTMHTLFKYAESVAPSSQPILITGESGSGKELMVKAIHQVAGPDTPLISVNVAGIDDHAFSDTLFGHAKGAFTGASGRRSGLVEKAGGGTLHLDEIGDLSMESQVKLLRLLEEREYYPLGSDTHRTANTRVILSTNRDIETLQKSERFRRDLYYRLCAHQINIPPLRERMDDLPLLLDHFIGKAGHSMGINPPSCSPEVVQFLSIQPFPGNIRELKNKVYDAVSRCEGTTLELKCFQSMGIRIQLQPGGVNAAVDPSSLNGSWAENLKHMDLVTIEDATTHIIKEALRRFDQNQSAAAQALGISRQRLARHLKKTASESSDK